MKQNKPSLFIITGLSGAGLSSTLKILEDLGIEVFDNFPISFLNTLLISSPQKNRPIAIGIDTRTRQFDPVQITRSIDDIKSQNEWDVQLLFLQADDHILLRRFTETRRVHPMARDRSISDGIAVEKALLYPLKYKANIVIDTSDLNIHDLRTQIEQRIQAYLSDSLNINIISFSYRHGIPREADMVFDMRFLNNPHWKEEYRHLTGLDKEIQLYIEQDMAMKDFYNDLLQVLSKLIPLYKKNGKRYLTIAFGCTGGQHRSVYTAQKVAGWFQSENHPVTIHHREMKH
jgi:RNase adapter protein RapZ